MMDRVGRIFSSLNLTIFLLLSLAVILAAGTIYEAENGTPAVRVVYYRAAWFDAFLMLLAANIVGCTYYRVPKRTTRWAYLLLHQSILVIFAGGLIGRWYGMEAQLQFKEGEEKAELMSEANILKVTWQDAKGKQLETYEWPTLRVDAFPKRLNFDEKFPMDRFGVNAHVVHYYPDLTETDTAVDGGPTDGPAVEVKLSRGEDQLTKWLFAKEVGAELPGGMRLSLTAGDPPPLKAETTRGGPGTFLELEGPNRSFKVQLDVAGKEGRTIAVPGTKYTVHIRRLFTHFSLKDKEPVEDPTAGDNPAVVFVLEGPGLNDPRIAFSNFPDFDEMHGKKKSGVSARYLFRPRELAFYVNPKTGALQARYSGNDSIVTGPVEPGRALPLQDLGAEFKVLNFKAHAHPGRVASNRSSEVKRPALQVQAENDVGMVPFWLPLGESKTVTFGESRATFEYTRSQIPMGFSLKLNKFTVGRQPGTMQPASFSSSVHLVDHEAGISGDRTISMNEPLVHRGYTFYQSSYVEGTPMISILQVAYDPGGPIAYLGFAGFIAGLFCIIWSRPKRQRASASTAS